MSLIINAATHPPHVDHIHTYCIQYRIITFTPVTINDVVKIVASYSNKSRDLGPLPTMRVNTFIGSVLGPITNVINT